MKRLFLLGAILAVCPILPGCGGGDGDGGDQANVQAPAHVRGHSVLITRQHQSAQEIRFALDSNHFAQFEPNSANFTQSGTYSYQASGASATLDLINSAMGEITTILLTFDSPASGTFTFTTSTGESGSGTFQNLRLESGSNPGPVDPGPVDPGPVDPGPGGPDGGLDGRTMSLTRTTGQTHFYTFTGNRFRDEDWQEIGAGTYQYTRTGNQATLILNYTETVEGDIELAGDRHEVEMTFTTETEGNYTGIYYTHDGNALPQDGKFIFHD